MGNAITEAKTFSVTVLSENGLMYSKRNVPEWAAEIVCGTMEINPTVLLYTVRHSAD